MKDAYMNLSFYQMWYFIRTIELGSYSRASQDLNVTQSTLSKCIQNIEQNLKMELFIREKNNLIPTEAAKNLYQVWKKMIVEMQETVEDARRYMGGRSESLKIGVLDSHKSESYLWEYVEAFHDLYPDISLAVESERPEVLHKKLMENELDVIFTAPLLMDNLDLMSRPVNYVTYQVASTDGKPHEVGVYFETTPQWAQHRIFQPVQCELKETAGQYLLR